MNFTHFGKFQGVQRYKWCNLWAFFGLYLEAVATIQSIINTHVNREQMSSYCLQKYL